MRRSLGSAVAGAALLVACGGPSEAEKERAIAAAERAYAEAERTSTDFSDGPCIANPLPGLPNWVADVAHDPRQDVDDEPQNQCSAYREGDADRFVELDPEGKLIRAD